MRAQRHILVDARGGAIADDLVLEHGDELAFGKVVDVAPDHAGAVIAHVRIDARYQRPDSGDVAGPRVPHPKPRLAFLPQSTSPGEWRHTTEREEERDDGNCGVSTGRYRWLALNENITIMK